MDICNNAGRERYEEEKHLERTLRVIDDNIARYSAEFARISAETKELYDNYRSSNPELHNDLVVGLDIKSQTERILNKNIIARKNPYFGRIDYTEHDSGESFSLYIGKHGIRKNKYEGLIVDWRAPVSSVYYESDIGESSYDTPTDETIAISLKKKRTYEISDSKLVDYYDSDVVANDEFLTKYLSKNKEVVLGEIIATIQKEQNAIIRDTPFHSVVVQGVAGSGKTTVAMHRISYILYNYKERFRPDEFYIIGSNRMLLNYITGVLPNLEVHNVNQMTMEEFFISLLDKDFDVKKGRYGLAKSFISLKEDTRSEKRSRLMAYKGSLSFIRALEHYLRQYELNLAVKEPVEYNGETLFTKEDMVYFLTFFEDKPMQEKIDLLNKKLAYKITSINELEMQHKEVTKSEVKRFRNYFGNRSEKLKLMEIYEGFLEYMKFHGKELEGEGIKALDEEGISLLLNDLHRKKLDIYDLGMLLMIKKKLKMTKDFDYVSHIVVDEAQDFGAMVFYLCKRLFRDCTYTIMGDVSQNIHYDTGMNDWEVLKNEIFNPEKDKFYVLAKSYRNTIEISEYAGRILRKCSFKTYDIEPIIRHGREVEVIRAGSADEMLRQAVDILKGIKDSGYDTAAVICRTQEETLKVHKLLKEYVEVEPIPDNLEDMTFMNGIMVLPIHMTKGLEFEAVIIWNPDEERYNADDADAKLLYVAATRAMHELYIIYSGSLSKLLI